MINRGIAAGITLAFLVAVRPDTDASRVGIAVTAILLYEGISYCIGYIRKHRKDKYITVPKKEQVNPKDIQRWADTWIRWPMKEGG